MQESWVIAVDLDGTLLRSDHTISAANKQTLSAAIDLGYTVIIATGRPLRTALRYHRELGLKTPLITLNGSMIWDQGCARVLSQAPISLDSTDKLTAIAEKLGGFALLAEVGMTCYQVPFHSSLRWTEEMKDFYQAAILSDDLSDSQRDWAVGTRLPESPCSLLLSVPRERHESFFTMASALSLHDVQCRAWHEPHTIIEVMAHGVSKATALQTVKRYLDVDSARVIAFGDELNDTDLLRTADIGVAMGNANPELVAHASDSTASNNDDGVARYLHQFFSFSLQSSMPPV